MPEEGHTSVSSLAGLQKPPRNFAGEVCWQESSFCFCLWPISVFALAKILQSRSRFRASAMVRIVQGLRLRWLIVLWFWLMSALIQVVDGNPGPFWHQLETSILRSFILGGWWYVPTSNLTREAWESFHWAPLLFTWKSKRTPLEIQDRSP